MVAVGKLKGPEFDSCALVGMAFPFTLISRLNGGPSLLPDFAGGLLSGPYPWFVLACLVVFVLAAWGVDGPLKVRAAAFVDIAASLSLGGACIVLAICPGSPLAYGSVVLGGADVAWLYVRWGTVYAGLGLRRAVCFICLSVMLASLQKLAIAMASAPVNLILVSGITILGLYCLYRSLSIVKDQAETVGSDLHGRHTMRDLWMYPVAVVILCAVLGCLYNLPRDAAASSSSSLVWGYLIEFAAAAAVLLWVCVARRSISGPGVVASLAFVVASGLVVLQVLGDAGSLFFFLLTNVDHSLLTLFLWIAFTDLSQWFSDSPWRVFAAGWALRSVSFIAGGCLAKLLIGHPVSTVYAVLMYVMVALMALVLAGRNASTTELFRGLDAPVAGREVPLVQRCQSVGQCHGLTPREIEVMVLLCEGRTRPYIAETFCISENTVRGHTKQVYRKLDIHNRESLISLVNEASPAGGCLGDS